MDGKLNGAATGPGSAAVTAETARRRKCSPRMLRGERHQAAVVMELLTGRAELAGSRASSRCSYRFCTRDYYRQQRAPICCFRSSDPLT
ncbi:hypothetical protein [Streptomyces sp. RKAG293]|uniref:hypothetical protein n=1 Tax=Streptomyces sp. RKAG293 TaxID=2893403 RepID=UPI0020340EFE|nr:hypothetical protein [Streptomyces sp. RKAG293]MCM2424256.1 hypothetical protein [Streptomyces sp. RKAG293]